MTRALKPCGTRAAYVRHLSYGQKPCDLCTAANRAYEAHRLPRTHYEDQLGQDIRELVHVLACAMGEGRRL